MNRQILTKKQAVYLLYRLVQESRAIGNNPLESYTYLLDNIENILGMRLVDENGQVKEWKDEKK